MKKFLAFILALAMMLCMGTALAAGVTNTFTLKKAWTTTGTGVYPDEEITMTEIASYTEDCAETTAPTITVKKAAGSLEFSLTPAFDQNSAVGSYYYLLQENDNGTAGATYDDTYYSLEVLVKYTVDEYGVPTDAKEISYALSEANVTETDGVYTWTGSAEKVDTITNEYADGTLNVNKVVTGNLGDKNKDFTVTVTFTSEKPVLNNITYVDDGEEKTILGNSWTGEQEVTIDVKHGETVTFTGIPYGLGYRVLEADYSAAGYTTSHKLVVNNSITIFYDADDTINVKSGAIQSVEITNDYDTEIATGINMDSMPYIVLIGLVVLAGVALMLKKRTVND